MTVEERNTIAQRKVEQIERQQFLRENRCKEAEAKSELRRKIIIGEMLLFGKLNDAFSVTLNVAILC